MTANNPSHLAYLEKLKNAEVTQCGGVRPSSQQIDALLQYLQQNNNNCVLLDLLSGEATTCIAATKLGIAKNAIAINPRVSSKILAQQEGVFGQEKGCEFFDVEDLLTAPPALLLDNPHLLSEKLKSATVIFCCAPPVLLKRLVPLMAALLNEKNGGNDDKVVITMMHHLPEKCTNAQDMQDIPGTVLRVYRSIVIDKEDIPKEKARLEVPESDWMPPVPEPCDPDDIDKEFARGKAQLVVPVSTEAI